MSQPFDINALVSSLLDEEGQEKQASEANVETSSQPSIADELKEVLLTKSASEVNQGAEEMGRALAARLLTKQASETPAAAAVEELASSVEATLEKEASEQTNVVAADNAGIAAEQASVAVSAEQSGGTVEQQTEETIQRGLSTPSATATSEDLVRKVEDKSEDANMLKAAALQSLVEQGYDFYDAADAIQYADSELQKEAAFMQLCSEGVSFEEAISLIKQASEIESQPAEFSKEAALTQLMSEGYSFDEAVAALAG